MTSANRPVLVVILALAGVGLVLAALVVPYQVDDAYIAYRYAAHLAAGHGPTFNVGSAPAEGFTSPVWCLLLAAAAWLAGPARLPEIATALGMLALLACLAVAARSTRAWGAAVSVALLATHPALTFYAATGMETLVFLGVVLVFAAAVTEDLALRWGIAAGALALAVRPEGAWLPVMAAAQLVAAGSWRRFADRRVWALAASVACGGLVMLAWRLWVFGLPLPLTYYAKGRDVAFGASYVGQTLTSAHAVGLLALGLAGALLGSPRHRGYLLGALAWLPAVIAEGGDWMPAGRFVVPCFGLLALAAAGVGAPQVLARLEDRRRRAYTAAVAVALIAVAGLQGRAAVDLARRAGGSVENIRREAAFIADWIVAADARSVAAVDIGLLGFRTGVEVVDLGGLTDPRIGLAPGKHLEKELDVEYVVRERRPDVIVIRIAEPPERDANGELRYLPIAGVERAMLGAAAFAADYRLEFMVVPPEAGRRPYYGKVLFARREFVPREAARLPDPVIRLRPGS